MEKPLLVENMTHTCESRLKFVREQIGNLTQQQIADLVGIPVHKIKSIETNKAKMSVDIALLIEEKFNFSFKWILTGDGPVYRDENPNSEKQTQSVTNAPQKGGQSQGKITDLITKTIEIFESNTVYSGALSANIDAFHEATRTEKKLQDLQVLMESRFKLMNQRMAVLETENKKLKDLLDNSPDNGESLASG